MERKHSLIASAIVALAFTAAAGAQTFPETISPSGASGSSEYTKLDKDKDGNISRKESVANKDLSKKWDRLDVNKDGKLDTAEFAAFEIEPLDAADTSPTEKY